MRGAANLDAHFGSGDLLCCMPISTYGNFVKLGIYSDYFL